MNQDPFNVAIVDYGLGNLFSVKHACEQVGLRADITSDTRAILQSNAVILPGVGAFGDAMDALRRLDLVNPLRDIALSDKPLIGICLGLQLLMSESDEFGAHRGLDIIAGSVVRFEKPRGHNGILKVPQVGWNRVFRPAHTDGDPWSGTPLTSLDDGAYMYFVHSFYAKPERTGVILSRTTYGDIEFASALRQGRVVAFQYHPERSGPRGLQIYRNIAMLLANPNRNPKQ